MIRRTCPFDPAAVLLALELAAGLVAATSLPARAREAHAPAPPPTAVVDENGRPGSAANPILLPATEANATRRVPLPVRGRVEFVLGPLDLSLHGTPGRVLLAGGGANGYANEYRTCSSNVYAGAGIGVMVPRAGGLYLDGGRVTLGDPFDALGYGRPDGEYWTTSAGVEIRF